MNSRHSSSPPRSTSRKPHRQQRDLLEQRPLALNPSEPLPRIEAKSPTWHPFLYRKRIAQIDPQAGPGDLVEVWHGSDQTFAYGLFNPKAEITVRLLRHGTEPPDEAWWQQRLEAAVALRRDFLRLNEVTNAYRLIHAEGDGLPGLVVDRFGDTLSAECFSLGMFQRAGELVARLAALCGTRHVLIRTAPQTLPQEGFSAEPITSPDLPRRVEIQEFGTRFRVDFSGGHKTGFFCDQRENRRQLATFCAGRSVLDLCCYSGGFAIQAKRLGQAAEVTGVELDEEPLALARENANLNQVRVQFVHADAFAYMRDMLRNGRHYDVVVLDPPKLIRNRGEMDEGKRKYFDLNRLAVQLVKPGGLLLSCSCSGLLPADEHLRLIYSAARHAVPQDTEQSTSVVPSRSLQLLAKTGAAPDHPVAANCPETEYLKAAWLRVV